MTCSARLPAYTLLIGAFSLAREVAGFGLQGLVLFAPYVAGIAAAMAVALAGATIAAIEYSLAGQLGHGLALLLARIGSSWQISIVLVLGTAAREVMGSLLATVYALSGDNAAHLRSALQLQPDDDPGGRNKRQARGTG